MLRAYFDDSGSDRDPRTPFSLIGGCIGSLAAWSRLERDWQAVLSEFGVAWLHMKDFAHSTGEFAGWDADEPKRQAFLGALVAVLLRDASAFIGCAVSNSAFRQLSDAHQHGLRHPYFLAFQVCMRDAAIQAGHDEDEVELIFARQPGKTGLAGEMFDMVLEGIEPQFAARIRNGLSFDEPRYMVPLQAVDLVAYELAHYVGTLGPGPAPRPKRWAMRQILDHDPTRTFFHIYLTRESIERGLPHDGG